MALKILHATQVAATPGGHDESLAGVSFSDSILSCAWIANPPSPYSIQKAPWTPNLSEMCPGDCFWEGLKFVKTLSKLATSHNFSTEKSDQKVTENESRKQK